MITADANLLAYRERRLIQGEEKLNKLIRK